MDLTLTNLSKKQVIDILSEIVSTRELAKITEQRMKNSRLTETDIINLLMVACSNNKPTVSETV